MRAIVLSGGGSKGSYQIGVWKALKKLHIKYDIVTGTSIGAMNGALMVQNDYYKAVNLWKKINLKLLFNDNKKYDTDLELYKMYYKNFKKNGGIDVSNIETLVETALNYNKFYKSKVNYGLIAYNVTTKEPLIIAKKDMPQDKLKDYIIASASCYPAFPKKNIDGNEYIDGGYYDNLPINLAKKLGATEIIAVDLDAPGIKRIIKDKNNLTYISPNNKLTNFLNFDEKGSLNNIKFGYNDTMKKFNKLEGNRYTFKKGTINKINKIHQEKYLKILNNILNYKKAIKHFENLIDTELNISQNKKNKIATFILLRVVEELGKEFLIDETKTYTYKSYNKELIKILKLYSNNELANKKLKNNKEIKLFNALKNNDIEYLRKKAFTSPIELLKAIYLYNIYEAKHGKNF